MGLLFLQKFCVCILSKWQIQDALLEQNASGSTASRNYLADSYTNSKDKFEANPSL